MGKSEEAFENALIGKKIPLLTLDHKWHRLFTQAEFTPELKSMEEELNKLIKRQGKVNTETKEIKKLKKKLMDDIVVLVDAMGKNPSKKQEKNLAEHKRLINDCNEKIEAYEEEMVELPRQINQINNKLMLITMEVCYDKLQKNSQELAEIDEWINTIRRELKKKVIRKQEKEAYNHNLYGYMHDIFGADVIELFDMKYEDVAKYVKNTDTADEEKTNQNSGPTDA